MPEVTNFNVGGQTIDICDPTARQKVTTLETSVNQKINNMKTEYDSKLADKLLFFKGKNIAFIGDSWGAGNGVGISNAYPALVGDKLGMNVYNACVGGSGYLRKAGGTGSTFFDELDSVVSKNATMPFDYVCVMGGFNDVNNGYEANDIREAALRLLNNIYTAMPNAQVIWCGLNLRCNNFTLDYRNTYDYLTTTCYQANGIVRLVKNWQWMLTGNANYYNADAVHPSVTGHIMIANAIVQSMLGGQNDYRLVYWAENNYSPWANTHSEHEFWVERVNDKIRINFGTIFVDTEWNTSLLTSTYTLPDNCKPKSPQVKQVYTASSAFDINLMINDDGIMYLQNKPSTNTIPANTTLHIGYIEYPYWGVGKH